MNISVIKVDISVIIPKRLYEFYKKIHKTALCIDIEEENIEIIKLLLTNDKLNINQLNISNINHSIKLTIKSFNKVSNRNI